MLRQRRRKGRWWWDWIPFPWHWGWTKEICDFPGKHAPKPVAYPT